MTRNLAIFGMLALLAAVPLAAAQDETKEENTTRPPNASEDASSPSQAAGDDAAWVEDCPPDMMCAAGGADEPTYGDCGGEVCAYDGEPSRGPDDGSCENCRGEPYGPEDCIECSVPPADTCMDGADAGESCDDEVQYLDGGAGAPAGPESAGEREKAVPGLAALGVLGAFVLAVALVSRRG